MLIEIPCDTINKAGGMDKKLIYSVIIDDFIDIRTP